LIVSFKIAKKLFSRTTAYLYTLFLSQYAVFHTKGLFNPHGAFFVLPLFYYLLIKYLKTNKSAYLAFHLLTGTLLIQFQLAIGIPYLALSSILIIRHLLKNKNYIQFLFFS